ncbi:hypothetical protein BG006_009497 [Podila minutissima]|uniref:Uncharacterized protein n=1 Tax=Podila minutissima TaxID=64525 RepID=A0A9P5VJE0_9FUNG|nr:hypothetical protein BG006_009497 [Podila minutissima]
MICDAHGAQQLDEVSDKINGSPCREANRKLRAYISNTIANLTPSMGGEKTYSKITGMSCYALPLLNVFLNHPRDRVIVTTPNTMTQAGAHRKELSDDKYGKKPDMLLSFVNASTQLVRELGYGELKGCGRENSDALNARDLVKVGLMLKDMVDIVDDKHDVTTLAHLGFQFVGEKVTFYLMAKTGSIYVMKQVCSMELVDSIANLRSVAQQYDNWRRLEQAVKKGYEPALLAIKTGIRGTRKNHFPTMSTPELRHIKDKY